MPTTQYKSAKPQYQTSANHGSQPPKGSIAVFEWKTFSPNNYDGTEQSLTEIFKRISEDIIERPYHYDRHKLYNKHGIQMTNPPLTLADNFTPPAKIKHAVVYKQNHGTGHALRQATYTRALIDTIAEKGNPAGKKIASTIRDTPKLKSAMELAAFCKRIGRTLDHEDDETADGRPPTSPKIYSKRSADMFAKIANELGYPKNLIRIIHDGMLEPSLKTHKPYLDVEGINGKELRTFTKNVLMAAHLADLNRLFSVKQAYVKSSIQPYFDAGTSNQVAKALIEMGCVANSKTGNAVVQQEPDVRHTPIPVKSRNNSLDQTIQQAIYTNNINKQNKTADLIVKSAVKNIMHPYHFPAAIKMVDNSRANDPKHDQHAMKVTFATPYSVDTKTTHNLRSGKLAYEIKATAFKQEKLALQTNSRHSNGFGPSS